MSTTIIWTANFPKIFVKTGISTKSDPTTLSWFRVQTRRHSTKWKPPTWRLLQNWIWAVFESMKSPNALFAWTKTPPRFLYHVGIVVCANLVANPCWKVATVVQFADARSKLLSLNKRFTIIIHCNTCFLFLFLYFLYSLQICKIPCGSLLEKIGDNKRIPYIHDPLNIYTYKTHLCYIYCKNNYKLLFRDKIPNQSNLCMLPFSNDDW